MSLWSQSNERRNTEVHANRLGTTLFIRIRKIQIERGPGLAILVPRVHQLVINNVLQCSLLKVVLSIDLSK